MRNGNNSKKHHWWPVGLQQHWSDRNGDISSIDPDGAVQKKRQANRNVGYKRHGHAIFRGSAWEDNFESEFGVDDEVHRIVASLQGIRPFGRTPSEFFAMLRLLGKKSRSLRDMCNFYYLDETLHRKLLLFLLSILIRSPASRSRYEGYPSIVGLPPDEEVGKGNMIQNYRIAKTLCQSGPITNQYFVLLHSPSKKFIFGDGSLDWLTGGLAANRIYGRALMPLTPYICVYFCTPRRMRTKHTCASLSAAPWMVDWVNSITQIYSKEKLFFLGRPPKLTSAFRERKYLEHSEKTDTFVDMLDDIAGAPRADW